jgi:hypothetical protein
MIDLATYPGVDPTGVGDSTGGIQAADQQATATGDTLHYGPGTYRATRTVTHTAPVQASDHAAFTVDHDGVGVQVGDGTRIAVRTWHLPKITKAVKQWPAATGVDVGVKVVSVSTSTVTIPLVGGFTVGVLITSTGKNGTAYNNFTLGHLWDNQVNVRVAPDPVYGWVNQNTFLGGRFAHPSNAGQNASGVRHLEIFGGASPSNGNTFIGSSLESPGVVEQHIWCQGAYNVFLNTRFENTTTAPHLVTFDGGTARYNLILGGVGAENLTVAQTNGASANRLMGQWVRWSTSGSRPSLALQNLNSATRPALTVLDPSRNIMAGTDLDEGWAVSLSATAYKGKRPTDPSTKYRVGLDHHTGALHLAAPNGVLYAVTVANDGALHVAPL